MPFMCAHHAVHVRRDLRNNQITTLPAEIGKLRYMLLMYVRSLPIIVCRPPHARPVSVMMHFFYV